MVACERTLTHAVVDIGRARVAVRVVVVNQRDNVALCFVILTRRVTASVP